jgi:hypothetical protein
MTIGVTSLGRQRTTNKVFDWSSSNVTITPALITFSKMENYQPKKGLQWQPIRHDMSTARFVDAENKESEQ